MTENHDSIRQLKLSGGPPKTASTLKRLSDGSLVIELYDYSPEAERAFGNDVAYLLTLTAEATLSIRSQLAKDSRHPEPDLLELIASQFEDYYALKRWLQDKQIPFEQQFDSWA